MIGGQRTDRENDHPGSARISAPMRWRSSRCCPRCLLSSLKFPFAGMPLVTQAIGVVAAWFYRETLD